MSRQRSSRAHNHFDALDGLRGVAALMVLLGHSSAMMLGNDDTFVFRKKLAVVFFFMLSGFVVTSAYEARIRRGYPIRDFLWRRAIRLFPMIAAGAVLSSIACLWFEPAYRHGWRGVAASIGALLCLPSPHAGFNGWTRFPINPPEWSLFYEIVAYVAFALVLVRLSGPVLLGVVGIALALFTVADLRHFPADMPFPLLSFGAIAAFGTGMLLFRLHHAQSLPDIPAPFAVLALVIVVMCVMPEQWGPWPNAVAFVVLCPLVMVSGVARGRGEATVVERTLGDLSFPLYIVHWPFLVVAHRIVQPRFGASAAIVCGMAAAIGAAWLLFRAWDDPVRRTLLALLAREKRRPDALPVAQRRVR